MQQRGDKGGQILRPVTERRGAALSRLAHALARMERSQTSREMIEKAREAIGSISRSRPRESVSVLLTLIPTLKILGDADSARAVYDDASAVISGAFSDVSIDGYIDVSITASITSEMAYRWRLRDSELDRLVRSQLEHGHLDLALEYASRIWENLLRERLLRTAAYIYLDEGNVDLAESAIRRARLPDITTNSLRDILFIKRRAGQGREGQSSM